MCSAPYIFTKVLRQLVKYWRGCGHLTLMYLNDGLGGDTSFESAKSLSDTVCHDIVFSRFTPNNRDLKIWGRPPCRTRPEVKMSLLRVLRMTILGWDRVQSLNRTPCFDFSVVSGTWVDFTWNFHKIALSFADFCHFCNSEHIFLLLVRLSFFHRCKEVRKR